MALGLRVLICQLVHVGDCLWLLLALAIPRLYLNPLPVPGRALRRRTIPAPGDITAISTVLAREQGHPVRTHLRLMPCLGDLLVLLFEAPLVVLVLVDVQADVEDVRLIWRPLLRRASTLLQLNYFDGFALGTGDTVERILLYRVSLLK